ncbi:unnamed protein product [Ectocarpus sp. CCAP 1310/34]|nr:unnamed protein product [Ectocarpus sp. CCAP 1310/34]
MDACAWTEEHTPTPLSTSSSAPGAPPLLRFCLSSTNPGWAFRAALGSSSDDTTDDMPPPSTASSCPGGRGRPSAVDLELVVSRGPGPDFSEHETSVASHAATLLSQALAGIRDRAALSEMKAALRESFRGMEEASDAVAVLVGERDRRAQREAKRKAELDEHCAGEIAAAEKVLGRARRDAEVLRRQLKGVCSAVTDIGAACGAGDLAGARAWTGDDAEEVGLSDESGTGKVIAVVERAARDALCCSFARVVRLPFAEMEANAESETELKEDRIARDAVPLSQRQIGEGIHTHRATSGVRGEDEENAIPHSYPDSISGDGGPGLAEQLQVHVPYYGSRAEPLVLSIRGNLNATQGCFRNRDRIAVASALAACLGIALQFLREKEHVRRLKERDEVAAACTSAAEAEARTRGQRAVAGMRALVAAAEASKAQARAEAAAAERADQQTDALRHLLSGLDEAGRKGHAAVAASVERLASAVVPGCEGSVLLTPRRHRSGGSSRNAAGVGGNRRTSFSPDPRAWATATASKMQGAVDGSERFECGKAWARTVEEAAVQAYSTGKTMCVTTNLTPARSSQGCRGGNDSGGAPRQSPVVCFSPVPAVLPVEAERLVNGENGRPGTPVSSDRMRAAELQREGVDCVASSCAMSGSIGTTGLLAWVLRLDAVEAACYNGDDEEGSGSPSDAVSPLTEAISEPPSPPPPHLPPRILSAINAVIHAVGLALFATDTADEIDGRPERSNAFKRRRSSSRRARHVENRTHEVISSLTGPGETQLPKSSREEELRGLRAGTAALAERVQTLEGRAAGLRASEARCAAALARARADVGATRGELQLAELELEWERKKNAQATPTTDTFGGVEGVFGLCSSRRGGRSGGVAGMLRPSCASNKQAGVLGVSDTVGSTLLGWSHPASRAERVLFPHAHVAGSKESETRDGGVDVAAMPSVSSPPFTRSGASSAALQHITSVHARLSDSLKRGRVGGTPAVGVV